MSFDQTHDTLRRAVVARELRAATRVVEVARERRVAGGETCPNAWRELEKNARDAVPQHGVRGFRGVVQDAGDDELLVRAELPKDARGLGRMAIVRAGRAEVAHGLLHSVEHARSSAPRRVARERAPAGTRWRSGSASRRRRGREEGSGRTAGTFARCTSAAAGAVRTRRSSRREAGSGSG